MAVSVHIDIPGDTTRLNGKLRSVIDRLQAVFDDQGP